MSTLPKLPYTIKASYLGPVFSLEAQFSKNDQNLIFARNGTGKSFLSRGFRYLDMAGQSVDVTDAAKNLVSDESPDGRGSFTFSQGGETLGHILLKKGTESPTIASSETIFHVFSEDFVEKELRERTYKISGEIVNQIAVDSKSIELEDAKSDHKKAEDEKLVLIDLLETRFKQEQISELVEKAGVNKRLKDFQALKVNTLFEFPIEIPEIPEKSFTEAVKELDKLKSIPGEPVYPKILTEFNSDNSDIETVRRSLVKVTSPSSVSDLVKKKIDEHRDFFEAGLTIIKDAEIETCPFCEQGINSPKPKDVIDAYVSYFSAEEEKHKSELRRFYHNMSSLEKEIDAFELALNSQNNEFNLLRSFIPSQKDELLNTAKPEIKNAREATATIKTAIHSKAGALATSLDMPHQTLLVELRAFNQIIEKNNALVEALNLAVSKSDEERKSLQREICDIFSIEFAITNWADLLAVRNLIAASKAKSLEVIQLEKSSPSTDAKARVSETFDLLLKQFFPGKYLFDRENFVLMRGEHEMSSRGPDRTLSDGEKTAIAFCYFIACIHCKVTSNSDYRRLFLIFDDPVTSMSYDFIFTIAQVLKNLNISNLGEISVNPGQINGNSHRRPRLLILTHSSYFFNISASNRVVDGNAAFCLHSEKSAHKLTKMTKYVAPFQEQLKEVYNIANGQAPDHRTANSIRSVLEAIGRFCRPDKSDSLTNFVQFLAGSEDIEIKSVLINTLSHGTYLEEIPPPDDLVLACVETLTVVKKYAIGQLQVIEAAK